MATSDEHFLYNTGCTPPSFHLFLQLPDNLRALVFPSVASNLCTRFIELYGFASFSFNPRMRYFPQLLPLFAISHETREVSTTHEGRTLAYLFTEHEPENMFYTNFERNIMFLSSRFTPSDNSTETSRLRDLSSLLKLAFLSQVRKVVVTYSSLNNHSEHLTGELLPDDGIGDVLYHHVRLVER